jgi:hypothetical protein
MRAYGVECHAAALDFLARGWLPVPVCNPDHISVGRAHGLKCRTPGLTPLVPVAEVLARRPTAKDLERWWGEQFPVAGVAIVLGEASGVIAIDVEGAAGEKKLLELSSGDLPPTAEVLTGGGRRLLYRLAPGAAAHTVEIPVENGKFRLLGNGVVLVMPPSRVSGDGSYRWKENGHEGG